MNESKSTSVKSGEVLLGRIETQVVARYRFVREVDDD